jgi:hypothetical protein
MMMGTWLEMKRDLRVPGPLADRMTDLTRQCLSAFCRSMLMLTSKLNMAGSRFPALFGRPEPGL